MNSLFKFRHFNVLHGRSAMKVGTDGVLLGAWVDVTAAQRVLDVGTGCGLIALMIAQRKNGPCEIDAVESDHGSVLDAQENFTNSPWNTSLRIFHQPIQFFTSKKAYNLIVSNPPFFRGSLKPPDESRQTARHADTLALRDIVDVAINFLSPDGRLAVILPPEEGDSLSQLMSTAGFTQIRHVDVRSRLAKPIERQLLEFSRGQKSPERGELIIHGNGDAWSDAYYELTKDFYLRRVT